MIIDPVTLPETALVSDANFNMHQYKIGGIPIIDSNNKLIGIVTNRDLRFEKK
jgi:IMP dehydrogenase